MHWICMSSEECKHWARKRVDVLICMRCNEQVDDCGIPQVVLPLRHYSELQQKLKDYELKIANACRCGMLTHHSKERKYCYVHPPGPKNIHKYQFHEQIPKDEL